MTFLTIYLMYAGSGILITALISLCLYLSYEPFKVSDVVTSVSVSLILGPIFSLIIVTYLIADSDFMAKTIRRKRKTK